MWLPSSGSKIRRPPSVRAPIRSGPSLISAANALVVKVDESGWYLWLHARIGGSGRPCTQFRVGLCKNSNRSVVIQNWFPNISLSRSWVAWNKVPPELDFAGSEILATSCFSSVDWVGAGGPTQIGVTWDDKDNGWIVLFSWRFSARFPFRVSVTFRIWRSPRVVKTEWK